MLRHGHIAELSLHVDRIPAIRLGLAAYLRLPFP